MDGSRAGDSEHGGDHHEELRYMTRSQGLAATISRRSFLSGGLGLGSAALAALATREQVGAIQVGRAGVTGSPHHAPKAKRVIYLYMAGGPSQLETFDFKPKLAEMDGQPMPESLTAGQPIAQLQGQVLKCQGPMTKFAKYGQSGQEISDFLPWQAKLADDICIVRSMVTEQINHDPAHTFMNTGTAISGRPSMGSWVWYGLGCESEKLPGFVVLTSEGGRNPQPISGRQWSAGFLPSRFQGVELYSSGAPVHYLDNPRGVSPRQQRDLVDIVQSLDRHRHETVPNVELDTRIAAYEMAFRMQSSVPELMDISNEPAATLEMYGA